MLKLNNISKSFVQRGIVLDNLGLEVSQGESVSVMGPSGSGKTTLLNIIGLLDKPDTGTVLFNNNPVQDFTPEQSAKYRNVNIGIVFQEHHMLPYLTIHDNIILPALAGRHSDNEFAEIENYAGDLMKQTGISSISGKYPFQVSGGEAQRASVIRALVNKPSLLLADEPTGSLDSRNSEIMAELLLGMNRQTGTALIIVTHSQNLASKMGRRLQLMDGKLIAP